MSQRQSIQKITLQLDNLDDRDGCCMVTLCGPEAAAFASWQQSFGGAMWEATEGDTFAYCMPVDGPELEHEAQELAGRHEFEHGVWEVEVDTSEYSPD